MYWRIFSQALVDERPPMPEHGAQLVTLCGIICIGTSIPDLRDKVQNLRGAHGIRLIGELFL